MSLLTQIIVYVDSTLHVKMLSLLLGESSSHSLLKLIEFFDSLLCCKSLSGDKKCQTYLRNTLSQGTVLAIKL